MPATRASSVPLLALFRGSTAPLGLGGAVAVEFGVELAPQDAFEAAEDAVCEAIVGGGLAHMRGWFGSSLLVLGARVVGSAREGRRRCGNFRGAGR